jgi:hypothetical protein
MAAGRAEDMDPAVTGPVLASGLVGYRMAGLGCRHSRAAADPAAQDSSWVDGCVLGGERDAERCERRVVTFRVGGETALC